MDIMMYIAKGRENAIRRDELVRLTNLPDRTIRSMIEEARNRGEIIINDGSGVGYYTSDDLGEITRQLNMNERRAKSVLVQNTHLRRKIAELESRDQLTIEEVSINAKS